MREITFRGKTKENFWAKGYYVGNNTIIPFKKVNYDLGYIDTSPSFECKEGTVGQFTGLTDCNGDKIFEGDILRFCETMYGGETVESSGVCSFEGCEFVIIRGEDILRLAVCRFDDDEMEIIGNIYDNPELLKGGKQ